MYARLHSYQLARQYFDLALAGSNLDDATRSKIAALEPVIATAITGSHAFAFFQTGVRYQTNAAFNPDNNILRLSGQDYTLIHPQDRGSDTNGFQALQFGYDHDLGNQRGDTLEFHLTGYATQQVRFTDLNVGLYDVSIGPRLKLADSLPDWTIKPYAVGGQAFLAGARYLASGGIGILADLPVRPGYLLEPGAEVRRVQFDNVTVFSSLNSGDSVSLSLAGTAVINASISALARVHWTRDSADAAAYQTSNNFAEEFAIVARFASPIPGSAVSWSLSPYVKLLQTRLDAPNPYIDASITRHDNETQVGLVLDTPLSAAFTFVTNVQYARVESNISSYRLSNFSVLTGPAVRF